jgi:hypothetical protein
VSCSKLDLSTIRPLKSDSPSPGLSTTASTAAEYDDRAAAGVSAPHAEEGALSTHRSGSQRAPAARRARERRRQVPYVELQCHFVVLVPRRRVATGGARGAGGRSSANPALASPTTTVSTARSSSRTAAKHFGVRPITGAEVTLADRSHVTLLVETQQGYSNLCRLLTAAHAHTRPLGKESQPPADSRARPAAARRAERRPRLPLGCARHGLAVRNPNAAARLAQAFGADRFFVELQAPYERGDARRNAVLRSSRRSSDVDPRHGDVHAHHPRARAAAGRARRRSQPQLARRVRGETARQPRVRAARAR